MFLAGCNVQGISETDGTAGSNAGTQPIPTTNSNITLPGLETPNSGTDFATPSISSSPASAATLLPEAREAYVLTILETNKGCDLPCFLGITPGESKWEDLRSLVSPVYPEENFAPNNNGIYIAPFSFNPGNKTYLEITFFGPEALIEQIMVDGRIYPSTNRLNYNPAFAQVMEQYSLKNTLKRFGVPAQIFLFVHGHFEPQSGTGAEIVLVYDEIGVMTHYIFGDIVEELVTQNPDTGALRACLAYDQIEMIRLYLQSPDSDEQLSNQLKNVLLEPLEKTTDLSIDDFYDLFIMPQQDICFEVP